jgi:hypothetical protein
MNSKRLKRFTQQDIDIINGRLQAGDLPKDIACAVGLGYTQFHRALLLSGGYEIHTTRQLVKTSPLEVQHDNSL